MGKVLTDNYGVAISTGIRSHCRPGFLRVFDIGDLVVTTSALRLASSEKLAIAVWLARHVRGGRAPDLLKCLPHWAYKQMSSGLLLEILSQYQERSGGGSSRERSDRPLVSETNRAFWATVCDDLCVCSLVILVVFYVLGARCG